MKKILTSLGMLSVALAYGQEGRVGINTENPNATLEVAGVPTNTNVLDGIIAPKITGNQLKTKTYTANQTGALVYVTEGASTANQTGQTVNVSGAGYYYFDGSVWQTFKGGAGSNEYLAGQGMILDGNTFSRTGLELTENGGYRFVGSEFEVGALGIDMNTAFSGDNVGAKGKGSIVMGTSNIASGGGAIAVGESNTSSSLFSISMGVKNEASGANAFAVGERNRALGRGSVVMGDWNEASGENAFAVGSMNNALGNYSFVVGNENSASGLYASALGWRNTNSGNYSFVLGRRNTNIGRDAIVSGLENNNSAVLASVFGWKNVSAGAYGLIAGRENNNEARDSFLVGYKNTNKGVSSAVIGENNIAEANYSFVAGANNTTKAGTMYGIAVGRENTTNYNFAVAMGNRNQANGVSSVAMGNNNIVNNFGEVALGNQNFSTDSEFEYDTTFPNEKQLFSLGNGRLENRSNALVVLRNGKTGIGIESDHTTPANSKPTEMLDVNGNVRVRGANTTITEGATCVNAGTITFGVDGYFYGCAGTTTLTWKKLHN